MFTSFNARAMGLTLSAADTLRLASEAGFGGVDVMVRDAIESGTDLLDLRRRMGDLGLRAGGFPFPFDWRGEEDRFLHDLRALPMYAEAARTLGFSRTATWVMPETPEGLDRGATHDLHVHRLGRIVSELDRFGIRLGLEVIGVESSRTGRGVPFVHRLDQLDALRADIETDGGGNVGVLVDSWHLLASGEPIAHAFAWGVDDVVWVHIADLPDGAIPDRSAMVDSVRGLPGGHGGAGSKALLAELLARGYDGPVTAEPLAKCRSLVGLSPEATSHTVARSLRAVWPGPDAYQPRDVTA